MKLKVKEQKLLGHFRQFPFSLLHVTTGGKFGVGEIAAAAIALSSVHCGRWGCTYEEISDLHQRACEAHHAYQKDYDDILVQSFKSSEHAVTPAWFPETKQVVKPVTSVLFLIAGHDARQLTLGLQALKINRFIDHRDTEIVPQPKFIDTLFEECRRNGRIT